MGKRLQSWASDRPTPFSAQGCVSLSFEFRAKRRRPLSDLSTYVLYLNVLSGSTYEEADPRIINDLHLTPLGTRSTSL